MRFLRAVGTLIWVLVHVLVLASALVLARAAVASHPGWLGRAGELFWPVVGLLAAGLGCPWLALAGRLTRTPWSRVAASLCGLGGYAPGAVLLLIAEPDPDIVWVGIAAALAIQAVGLVATARSKCRAAAIGFAVGTAAAAVWVVWILPPAKTEALDHTVEWLNTSDNRPMVGGVVAGLVLVSLVWLLLATGVRRRWAWWAAVVVAFGTWPGYWLGLAALDRPVEGIARFGRDQRFDGLPNGLFADAACDRALGWHWVRTGMEWREALLVRPPARLTTTFNAPPDGTIQLHLTLPRQHLRGDDRSVRVRCTLFDDAGDSLAQETRDLYLASAQDLEGSWVDVVLPSAGPAGRRLSVAVEADIVGGAGRGAGAPVLALSSPTVTPPPDGPNCLVILVDALRADRLHCYGYPQATSPRIDRLAAEGVLFERVISACSWTVPSVESLFTGTYVATHGALDFEVPGRLAEPTLARSLSRAGIRTAAVSANTLVYPGGGFAAGFDAFIGAHVHKDNRTPRGDWVTDHALRFLEALGGRRFFLYLHYMDVHAPYQPPAGWARFGHTREQRYLGEILYCDSEIRRLLSELDRLGLANDTLVVFMADHGEAFMEHGFWDHGETVHREEIHVPLILRLPGRLPAGRRVPTQVRSIDVHATIRDLMGVAAPRQAEGESLAPVIAADPPAPHRVAFAQTGTPDASPPIQIAIQDDLYKLILNLHKNSRRLYDVRLDPGEQADLSGASPDRADAMEERIRRFLRERGGVPAKRALTDVERQRLRAVGYLDPGGR